MCADKSYEFATSYRSDSHRRAATFAKNELCRVVKDFGLLYGPFEWEVIPEASAYSYDSSKLCSGTGALNSNKDEGSRRAAQVARDRLCGKTTKQASPVLKPTVQIAPCYMVRGVCIVKPAKRVVR